MQLKYLLIRRNKYPTVKNTNKCLVITKNTPGHLLNSLMDKYMTHLLGTMAISVNILLHVCESKEICKLSINVLKA